MKVRPERSQQIRSVIRAIVMLVAVLGFAMAELDDFAGKKPFSSDVFVLDRSPAGAQKQPPVSLVNLQNASRFIRQQRGLEGRGLPATFYVPGGVKITDPLRELIIHEGVGLYDTALAIIALVEAGDVKAAQEIIDIYVEGQYSTRTVSPLELRAFPVPHNGHAFSTFDDEVHYFFDFTNVHGDWLRWRSQWKFWSTHTGPNAWFTNALVRFIEASRQAGRSDASMAPYLRLARRLGQAMIRLQDAQALGGVRYGPQNQHYEEGTVDPFLQINSENNLSAYVAFRMLYGVTRDEAFARSAEKILNWFHDAPVWTLEGKPQKGLFDRATSTLAMGAQFENGRWVLQPERPTDSGGTWAISSLGPKRIDSLWGRGSAYRMWRTIRQRAGRTAEFKWVRDGQALAGLDYTDAFAEEESLISPEWSAGGLFALRLLVPFYATGEGKNSLTPAQLASLRRDLQTMSAFIRQRSNAYAIGPGHGGKRQGKTGFGWYCPPEEVHAMASIYVALFFDNRADPSAWWHRYDSGAGS